MNTTIPTAGDDLVRAANGAAARLHAIAVSVAHAYDLEDPPIPGDAADVPTALALFIDAQNRLAATLDEVADQAALFDVRAAATPPVRPARDEEIDDDERPSDPPFVPNPPAAEPAELVAASAGGNGRHRKAGKRAGGKRRR